MQIGYCSEDVDAFVSPEPHPDTIELARKLIDEIQSGENHALIHPTYLLYQLFKKVRSKERKVCNSMITGMLVVVNQTALKMKKQ